MTIPTDLASRWTAMWNGQHLASEIVSPDCKVYFGRAPTTDRLETTSGPDELQAVIDETLGLRRGIAFSFDSSPLYQSSGADAGIVTLMWEVGVPGGAKRTGIDLLRHEGEVIREVWSITGDLPLPPMC